MCTSSHSPTSSLLQRSKFLIYSINPPQFMQDYDISLHQQFWWDNNWRETSQDIIWFSAMQRIYLQKVISVIRTITELRNINIKPGGWTLATMKSMSSFLKFPTLTTIDLIEHPYLKLPQVVLRNAGVYPGCVALGGSARAERQVELLLFCCVWKWLPNYLWSLSDYFCASV